MDNFGHRVYVMKPKGRDHVMLTKDGVWESMQLHGFYFSELQGHIADLDAGHILTADDGTEFSRVR